MTNRRLPLSGAMRFCLGPVFGVMPALAEDCEPAWTEEVFCMPGLDDSVSAAVLWNDGSGAKLYVCGVFTLAGCSTARRMAVWDGTQWSALAPSAAALNDTPYALVVFDDGDGEDLFVGGEFTSAGPTTLNGIARWDGSSWTSLSGPSGNGVNGVIYALCEFDDGNGPALFAGGNFLNAGGIAVNHIARWDGHEWSALTGTHGTGVGDSVQAMTVFDDGGGPALYVGGYFITAGGITVNRVARWDGHEWSILGDAQNPGVSRTVFSLYGFDDGRGPALFAGGTFTSAGGIAVNRIARWDGKTWSPLSDAGGTGTSEAVRVMCGFDDGRGPALFVGGAFATAGGLTANRIARWDGNEWSTLADPDGTAGVGRDDVVSLIAFDDGTGTALYAGGTFRTAGSTATQRFARWTGTHWGQVGSDAHQAPDGAIMALHEFDHALYAGGDFVSLGDQQAPYIARWSNGSWTNLPGGIAGRVSDRVLAFAVHDQPHNPIMYAAGDFLSAGGVTVNRVAAWDGTTWMPLTGSRGTGVNNRAVALALYDDGNGTALYAGGLFISAGGIDAGRIAKWDGLEWSTLDGPNGEGVRGGAVRALATFDDGGGPALFAAGAFTTAGGIDASRIARWNGSEWSALQGPSGEGTNNTVWALCVYDDGTGPALYIGGAFTMAGGVSASRIARWDGADFTPLLTPTANGVNWTVRAMHASGPNADLYVGGEFGNAGGVFVNRIARWDGRNWFALGSSGSEPGLNDWVMAIWSGQRGGHTEVYAGGFFTEAAEASSRYIARWGCPFDPCLPDLNGDSTIDAFDVLLFTGWLNDQDPRADINEDGLIDYFDAIAFVAALELGCP